MIRQYKTLFIFILLILDIFCFSKICEAVLDDTSLKSISIEPNGYELVQDENDNKIYRVKVDNSVNSVKINAIPNNKDATISVEGNDELTVGTNKVIVTVSTLDGKKSIYTIYVRRASAPISQENVIPNVQEEKVESESENKVEKTSEQNEKNLIENTEKNNENTIAKEENKETSVNSDNTNDIEQKAENNEQNENNKQYNNKKIIFAILFAIVLLIICFLAIKKAYKGKH